MHNTLILTKVEIPTNKSTVQLTRIGSYKAVFMLPMQLYASGLALPASNLTQMYIRVDKNKQSRHIVGAMVGQYERILLKDAI